MQDLVLSGKGLMMISTCKHTAKVHKSAIAV